MLYLENMKIGVLYFYRFPIDKTEHSAHLKSSLLAEMKFLGS